MFDIFYLKENGPVNVFNAKPAESIEHARQMCKTRYFWIVDYLCDYSEWDFLWEPSPWESQYMHAWPSQWQKDSETYLVPVTQHEGIQYHQSPMIWRTGDSEHWQDKSIAHHDYTWHPDPSEPPYIYQFGTQHQKTGGPVYVVPGAKEVKYYDRLLIWKITIDDHWDDLDFEFDYTWHPDDTEEPYIYQFGTQHQKTGGPRYTVPGATQTKFICYPTVEKTSVDSNWNNLDFENFDYTWHPDATDIPYIYQFGTQHQKTGGPQYIVPGATRTKFVNQPRVTKTKIDSYWDNTDFNFDYTWHPDETEKPYIYQFGTQHQKTGGPRYTVPGATEVKFVREIQAIKDSVDENWNDTSFDFDYTWHPDETEQPYIYQFGTQWQKTGGPQYIMPGATEIKYVTIPRANKTDVDDYWTIPHGIDFDDFDYTWHPDATEEPYIYQFGTQHQKTGGPRYTVPGATEVKYVEQIKITTKRFANGVVVIDHLDGNADLVMEQIKNTLPIVKKSRYFDNYLDTIKRVVSTLEDQEYVWIVSSVCDYADFDFSWHPETWQAGMLHVFASNEQKFGDTFFVHVPSFLSNIDKYDLLEWYDCNFVKDVKVPRRALPVIMHNKDTHLQALEESNLKSPLTVLTVEQQQFNNIPTVALWRKKTKNIVPLDKGGASVIVPKTAIPEIKTQFYDYEYIDKTKRDTFIANPMDIVFISNGESNAERNWEHLCESTQNVQNRVVRVDGVNGRAQAYCAAVEASNTPWAFCVFAKLEVDTKFNWGWQPDRLQAPKHYIFHAKNPVNGLQYGHMAMIAYNKDLTLNTVPTGLDFTLDSEHEVVPIVSGTARYADDPWVAWRSAFRECIKLYHSLPNVDNEWRLNQWLTVNLQNDVLGEWSIRGAQDAIDYYNSVQGSFDALRLTYEWVWLAEYFTQRYNQSPDQLCTQFQDQLVLDR